MIVKSTRSFTLAKACIAGSLDVSEIERPERRSKGKKDARVAWLRSVADREGFRLFVQTLVTITRRKAF